MSAARRRPRRAGPVPRPAPALIDRRTCSGAAVSQRRPRPSGDAGSASRSARPPRAEDRRRAGRARPRRRAADCARATNGRRRAGAAGWATVAARRREPRVERAGPDERRDSCNASASGPAPRVVASVVEADAVDQRNGRIEDGDPPVRARGRPPAPGSRELLGPPAEPLDVLPRVGVLPRRTRRDWDRIMAAADVGIEGRAADAEQPGGFCCGDPRTAIGSHIDSRINVDTITMATVYGGDKVSSGLEGVVAATTRLSEVDGERGELTIAGFPVGELAAHATFEETTWLLWHGELPTAPRARERSARRSPPRARCPGSHRLLREWAARRPRADGRPAHRGGHDLARVGRRAAASSPDADDRRRVLAVAARARSRSRRAKDLGHAANFLYMLTGDTPEPGARPRARDLSQHRRRSRPERVHLHGPGDHVDRLGSRLGRRRRRSAR